MSFSMSQTSLPAFIVGLNAMHAILDKAEAFAKAKKIDSTVLTAWRLAPDMFALARQVQVAADQAKNSSARLAGIAPPRFEDDETTIEQLKTRVAKTVAFLNTLDPSLIDASADREITFPLGPDNQGRDERRRLPQPLCAAKLLFSPDGCLRDPTPMWRRNRQARFSWRHPADDDLSRGGVWQTT